MRETMVGSVDLTSSNWTCGLSWQKLERVLTSSNWDCVSTRDTGGVGIQLVEERHQRIVVQHLVTQPGRVSSDEDEVVLWIVHENWQTGRTRTLHAHWYSCCYSVHIVRSSTLTFFLLRTMPLSGARRENKTCEEREQDMLRSVIVVWDIYKYK